MFQDQVLDSLPGYRLRVVSCREKWVDEPKCDIDLRGIRYQLRFKRRPGRALFRRYPEYFSIGRPQFDVDKMIPGSLTARERSGHGCV